MGDSDDVQSKLPEWFKVLREIYEGVENGKAKSRPSRPNADQAN
jgi:hypothetical protein